MEQGSTNSHFFHTVKWATLGSNDKLTYAIFKQTHEVTAIVPQR
jgi:hypothetical protein